MLVLAGPRTRSFGESMDKMEARIVLHILVVALGGFVSSTGETIGQTRTASACYGNFMNFLFINCPADTLVNLTSVRNGARLKERGYCPEQTTPENYISDCCQHMEDDCMVHTHPNSFPAECRNISFCKPQSSWTRTQPTCNGAYYPAMTHYTEMTYECVLLVPRSTTTPSTSTATTSTTTTTTSTLAATTRPAATTTTTREFTPNSEDVANSTSQAVVVVGTPHLVPQDAAPAPDFTPAMIGGMVAGLVGLLITVFVFMFYWGRKRQIRISGGGGGGGGKSRENSVWDFLLANSMSVRAFRGYDNFSSSSSRRSLDGLEGSSEDGSPGVRKTPLWLPNNISMDSGQGSESAPVTSDDNCSVITAATLERADRHLHPPPGHLYDHHHPHHHNNHQTHLIYNHLSSGDVNQLGAGGQHHHYQSHPHLFHPHHHPHHVQQQHRRHSSRRQRRQEEEERARQREGGGAEEVWGGGTADSFVQLSLQGYRYTVVANTVSTTGGPGSSSSTLDPPRGLDPADDPPPPSPEGGARRTDSSTLASPNESAVAALRSRTPATSLSLPGPTGLVRAWETAGETRTPSGEVLDAPRATELQQADRSGQADLGRSRLAITATERPPELPNQSGVHAAASAAAHVNIIVNRL